MSSEQKIYKVPMFYKKVIKTKNSCTKFTCLSDKLMFEKYKYKTIRISINSQEV